MTSPRRLADGPALSDDEWVAPRRGAAPSPLRGRIVAGVGALAAAVTLCAVVASTATSVAVPAAVPSSSDATQLATALSASRPLVEDAEQLKSAVVASNVQESAQEARATAELAAKAAADAAAKDAAAKANKSKAKAAVPKAVSLVAAGTVAPGNFAPATKYGLKGGAVKTYNVVMSTFTGFQSVGGWRASSLSNHQLGLAIDFMLIQGKQSAFGWTVAKFLAAHAAELNINHIIFEQHIWTPRSPTWRLMPDRGDATANHMNHVHVSMNS